MAAPPPNPNQYPYQNGTPLSPPHPNQYANQPHQGAPRPNLTSPNARPHPPPGQYQQHQRPYPGQPISPQQQPPYPGRPHPQHPQHPQHPPTQSPQHHPYPQNPNIRPTGPGPRPFARPPFPPQHQQHQQHQQNQFHPQQQGSELHVPADTPSPISSAGPATPNVGTPGVPTPSSTRRRLYPEQMGNAYNAQPEPQPVNQFNQTNPMEPQLFVPGAPAPAMPSTMQYPGQQPQAGGNYPQTHPDINSLAGQMGNMNLNAGAQMTPTIPLLNVKPSMNDVLVPPPQPKIPPGIALTQSEFLTCDPAQKRSTVNAFPATPALVKKAKLPLGLVIVPHKTLEEHEHVPIVTEIVRCRACRTYINPFVTFIQHTKWRCNVCHVQNDVPQSFDYDLISRQPIDRLQRPELNYSIVDYLAPTEYMVRPPQPPIYVFVIDVSYAANQNGMLAITAKTILENLDRIPNQDNRVKVAFITFDSSVHFYKLSGEASEPQMLVCPDLDEVYLPQPDDLLVNLADARPCIEAFLSRLGLMFNQTHNVSSALGPALHSAHKLLSAFGGKITLFQSTLPTLQSGDLTTREDAKLLGTPKESSLLLPANNFYKNFALDCSKVQICVDMFLFGNQYLDVATLSSAAKFTGGQMFYYPGFNQNRSEDVNKYSYELGQFLSNPIGLEAVLRVRCTRGIRANTYYGNFFLRSTDLIALPNVTPNHAYTVELALDEKIETSTVYFQTALLHTSCYGERRIRVMTMALPVTSSISELYQSVDQQALAAFIAKKAVDRAVNSKLDDAREAILYKCAELLYTFKTELTPANSGATTTLPIYANIALYPLLSLAMLKHISLRGGSSIGTDARTAAINLINILPADQLITYLLPKFYSLHDLSPEFGVADANGQVLLPQALPLRGEFIQSNGIYMLYNGQSILLYISHATDPDLLMNLFAVASYGALFGGKVTLPELDNSFNKQVHGIINKLRKQDRNTFYPEVYVVKEDGDPTLKLMLNTWLVEDRSNNVQDYNAFTLQLREKVNSEKF